MSREDRRAQEQREWLDKIYKQARQSANKSGNQSTQQANTYSQSESQRGQHPQRQSYDTVTPPPQLSQATSILQSSSSLEAILRPYMKTKIAGPLLPCGHNTIFEGPIEPDTDDDAPWKCKYCEKFRIEIFDLPMFDKGAEFYRQRLANLNAAIESAQRAGAIRETSDLESSSRAYELDDDEDVELFESRYEDSQDVILVDPFDKTLVPIVSHFRKLSDMSGIGYPAPGQSRKRKSMKKPIWFESPCGTSGVGTSDEPFTKIEVATNTIIQLAKIIKTPLIKFRDHERQNSRPSRSTLTVESQQNSYLTTLAAMYDTNLQDQRLALDAYAAREPFQFDDAFNLTERPDEHLQNEDAGDDENDGGVQLPPFERDPEKVRNDALAAFQRAVAQGPRGFGRGRGRGHPS